MKKLYRCPCCGRECLRKSDKINMWISKRYDYYRYTGNRCYKCGGIFTAYPVSQSYDLKRLFFVCFFNMLWVLSFILIFFNPLYVILLFLYTIICCTVVIPIYISMYYSIVKLDFNNDMVIIPEPEHSVILTQINRKIRNFDIFGFNFIDPDRSSKLREVFEDGLVPVVFRCYNQITTNQPVDVYVINKELVPEELLQEGSQFVVIDNGIEIASGYISKEG